MKDTKIHIYTIADTHFYHHNIIGYCHRPFKYCSEMNEKMISKWNGKVSRKDIVIHCGDFAFFRDAKKIKAICKRLNGRKILVRGNHDRQTINWYLNHGFDFVCDSFTIGRIIFTHRPMRKQDLILSPYDLNIHGHLHQKDSPHEELYENVCVERTNYYPVNLDRILGKHGLKLKRRNKQGD
jgi:calcineurin-like phosphoesterase family protein